MKYAITFLLLMLTGLSYSQTLNELYKESVEVYKDGNYSKFRELNKQALKLHPSHPTLLYNLAASYSLTKDYEMAYEVLNKLLSWKANVEFEKDKDFKELLSDSILLKKLKLNREKYIKSKISSSVFLELPKSNHIEDFVIINDFIYYTDVHQGTVIKYNFKNKTYNEFHKCDGSAMAIVADKNEKYIWVSSSMIQNTVDFNESQLNKSFIYKLNALNGKVNSKISIPNESVIGSLIISDNNKLYATNSKNPEIYIINMKTNVIESTIVLEEAFNLQGIVIDNKNNCIYVADYIKGIVRINLKDYNDRVWLKSENYLLKGIDGLNLLDENNLIAIQNNSNPKRIIKLKHNLKSIVEVKILDNALSTKGDPTCGKLVKNGFLYLSNSQWPFYDKVGKPITDKWEAQIIRLIKEF